MENVHDRIRKHFNHLTNQQKLVAKFFLDEPKEVALHPAKVIGGFTKTSETTVIRLCYALEYSGYSELQNEIRKHLLSPVKRDSPLLKYHDSTEQGGQGSNLFIYNMEQDLIHIQQSIEQIDIQLMDRAVESIIRAKKIYVVGFRSSFAPAQWLYFTLNVVKGNTFLYQGQVDDANHYISEASKDCLVIAISFPRYVQETISFTQAAKEKGAKVLAISDDELSPIGVVADLLLKVTTPLPTTLKGMSTMFSVLNALISGVAYVDREKVQKRIRKYEEASHQFYPFVDQD
ncbi:MurR/RpiR family transcriptional regulator [Brevibacillus daliensis]|uniref:MurR/RpiR family transcriptional regulator n=1 Tax=Brevibacillus daliensis TaxID=2892995 RepID=UPI0021070709|nr:MurR/RpiR family transcriptional regulator [Brevibacillus daliensis]